MTERSIEEVANSTEIAAWMVERDRALIALDLTWAGRKLDLPEADDFVLLIAMHKARYNIPSIPAALRRESATWLRYHGLCDYDDVPLLPIRQYPTEGGQ